MAEPAGTYEVAPDESFSDAVVQAVSSVSSIDPIPNDTAETTPADALDPLYTVVDPDALDAVFESADGERVHPSAQVSFSYHGYAVTVRSEGTILVHEQ